MATKLLKNEIEYLIFNEIYQRFQEPKAKRKALSLIEAAITCIAKKGFESVTLEMVAREAAVTRPLIKHYFSDLEELKLFSIKYIRLLFQKLVVTEMGKVSEPDKMISVYIESCFVWIKNHRIHAMVWLAFLHRCAQSPKMRAVNTEAVRTGDERIKGLLALGKTSGFFKFDDLERTAKMIQVLITGAMMSSVSEDFEEPKNFILQVRTQCLDILGAKK